MAAMSTLVIMMQETYNPKRPKDFYRNMAKKIEKEFKIDAQKAQKLATSIKPSEVLEWCSYK